VGAHPQTRGIALPTPLFFVDTTSQIANFTYDMTLTQFQKACAAAKNPNLDLSATDDTMLFGYGLPSFRQTHTTLAAVAKILRWDALQFNGEWDAEALNQIGEIGRKKFLIVD
jgi:hypothetical protein